MASVYLAVILLLQIPTVQAFLGTRVASAIGQKLGTTVTVGRVDLGFLNRVIIDKVMILDRQRDTMLVASRLSAKIELAALGKGRIAISSAQIFGLDARLNRANAEAEPNYQFVLDSLASKDTTAHTPLDLHINSLVVRRGAIRYDRRDAPFTPGTFNADHLALTNLSGHFMLNQLTDTATSANVKMLAFRDRSGFTLKDLHFKFEADRRQASLKDFVLELPHTRLVLGPVTATYSYKDGRMEMPTLQFEGSIAPSTVTPGDLRSFLPPLGKWQTAIRLKAGFSGTSTSIRIKGLGIDAADGSVRLSADGNVDGWNYRPRWFAAVRDLRMSAEGIRFIVENLGGRLDIPQEVRRMGSIAFVGEVGGYGSNFAAKGIMHTEAGNANIALGKSGRQFSGRIETAGLNLRRLLDDPRLGTLATRINIDGTLRGHGMPDLLLQGVVSKLDYNTYTYSNIHIDGTYRKGTFNGTLGVEDPNVTLQLKGNFNLSRQETHANLTLEVERFNPSALNISHAYPGTDFGFNLTADFTGRTLAELDGSVRLNDFAMKSAKDEYTIDHFLLEARRNGTQRVISLDSDFAQVRLEGRYDYKTLAKSFINMVGDKLPTLPGLPPRTGSRHNDFSIDATITRSDWLQHFFHLPLTLTIPARISGTMSDHNRALDMQMSLPAFAYDGTDYRNGSIVIDTPGDTLKADISVDRVDDATHRSHLKVSAAAADNKLATLITYRNRSGKLDMHGSLNAETTFFKYTNGVAAAHARIMPSDIVVGDSVWKVQPSDIVYSKNHLTIDHFALVHNDQHVIVSGLATNRGEDSLLVDLRDVDVNYILNLVNFHSVEFAGRASGRACISSAFNSPSAYANLTVNRFRFEGGRMGTLSAHVDYNKVEGRIDIDATADDGPGAKTLIRGYVSPKHDNIDLGIEAQGTRLEFLESFCGSFMSNVDARAHGKVTVAGPLSSINLTGDLKTSGSLHVKPTNTDYTFKDITIHAVPNEIYLVKDSVRDRNGHLGIVDGAIHHKHLTQLSYDIDIKAHNLLAFDTHEFGGNTFYATVYATGSCGIHGKSGETVFDIDARPEKGSVFVYNAASPDAIGSGDFIHWHDATPHDTLPTLLRACIRPDDGPAPRLPEDGEEENAPDIPSDMRINFVINCNQNLTLKLMMDNQTGDYIALNGDGVLRANYFNKGAFDMFGTYVVDHGIYKLTIQNIIKKDFIFNQGGTITFGGDAYNANLNLAAQYVVNGVSLSDLNIGRRFSSNNIRVNCLMNITGTPKAPKIDFALDLPTVNSDAKQMVYSLINSEEEMNQQVLYLLAVGRFYSQGNNNAPAEQEAVQQSQTSLAMQSLLSGTISQQLNNVLSTVVNNTNWNFGANISTGDEGWNNAEYEGILNGRLLNNRLLINGQFGYRDNANATTSFIGDFDIRYLLFPNGNLAVRVYNQTNDRYFTRNSLNTQGLGFIIKKDFSGIKDLFGFHSKKKLKTVKEEKKATDKP